MDQPLFRAKRVTRSYRQRIDAPASTVFPLLCPVREGDWLDGWNCTLIYSRTGFAEEGCVFTTLETGGEETIWMITRRDVEEGIIEFARITPKNRAVRLALAVQDAGDGTSRVDITYTYTALSEEGNRFIEEFAEEAFQSSMRFWQDSMNHYLKTGKKLTGGSSNR